MKKYIKSASTADYIRQNQRRPKGGYLYIFKHGIGPGTLPKDVEVIKTKDLPNNYTAVWTDRFLTTSELKQYDIPSETEINRYLDRIGYCQKDGDVVPCDDVEACGKVLCSTSLSDRRHDAWVAYYKNIFPYLYDFKETKQATRLYNASFRTCLSSLPYSNPVLSRYWIYDGGWLLIYATPEFKVGIETLLPQGPNGYPPRSTPEGTFQLFYEDSDGVTCKDYFSSLPELCDKVNELTQNKSTQYQPSWTYRLSDLYNKAFSNGIEACGDIKASTYVSQVWLPEDKKWEDIQEYNKWDNTWCEGCGRGPYYDIEDARADGYRARIIVRDESGRYVDEVEACNSVMASTKPHPKIPEGWERVPEGDDDDGNWGTIAKALPNNQGYYWINIVEDEQGRRCFELEVGYRGDDGAIGKIWKASSKPFYRLGDIVKYADTKWRQLQAEYDEDVEACGDIKASTDNKYFANMVNCSTDELDDEFLVEGYYDNQYRGLAESAETSDVSALNEYINDYANKGYFIRVYNYTDGVITEFSADNWFDDIARDGGAALFMSW